MKCRDCPFSLLCLVGNTSGWSLCSCCGRIFVLTKEFIPQYIIDDIAKTVRDKYQIHYLNMGAVEYVSFLCEKIKLTPRIMMQVTERTRPACRWRWIERRPEVGRNSNWRRQRCGCGKRTTLSLRNKWGKMNWYTRKENRRSNFWVYNETQYKKNTITQCHICNPRYIPDTGYFSVDLDTTAWQYVNANEDGVGRRNL